jgi:MFS family permease
MSPTRNRDVEAAAGPANGAAMGKIRLWLLGFLELKIFEALRHSEYRLLWIGHVFSSMATWMDQVTRGWLIYELTNSSFQLGLVRGVQALPILLLAPIAGSTADRYSRKSQVLVALAVDALMCGLLAALIFARSIEPWHVYVTATLMASVWTFQQPSRASMLSDSVPPESLTNAIGLSAMMFNVARIIGPAGAGLIIAGWSTGGAYAVQSVFYVLATIWAIKLLTETRSSGSAHGHGAAGQGFFQSIATGWKFSWRNLEVRTGLLVLASASLFIIPFNTLLPVFARDLLDVGAKGQGLLLTSMGIGALASSVLIASLGDRLRRGIVMICGVGTYGLLVVLFGLSTRFPLSMVLIAIMGLCHVASHALVQTVIQAYSPREFRGRTMALFHMSQVVMTVGSMIIGALAAVLGAQWSVVLMSAAGALAMLGIHLCLPRAWHIR